jgi:hypothetical protein
LFLATYLHLDVENHNPPLLALLPDRHLAGAVPVAAKLGVLDEAAFGDEPLKLLHADKVVLHGVVLAGAGRAGRVRDGERKDARVALAEHRVERALADARGPGDDDGADVKREAAGCRGDAWLVEGKGISARHVVGRGVAELRSWP